MPNILTRMIGSAQRACCRWASGTREATWSAMRAIASSAAVRTFRMASMERCLSLDAAAYHVLKLTQEPR
jgi:hypothetical protein